MRFRGQRFSSGKKNGETLLDLPIENTGVVTAVFENKEILSNFKSAFEEIKDFFYVNYNTSNIVFPITINTLLGLKKLDDFSIIENLDIDFDGFAPPEHLKRIGELFPGVVRLGLKNLTNKVLYAEHMTKLQNLRHLTIHAHSLQEIYNLMGLSQLKSLSFLKNNFSKIRDLLRPYALEKENALDDYSIRNLESLSIPWSFFESMDGLQFFPGLIKLNLHINRLKKITDLDNMKNLKELNLSTNHIDKIGGLDGLISLEKLNLKSNLISKIEGLDALKNLKELNLSDNLIDKVEGLDRLVSLSELNLSWNKITETEGLSDLKEKLKELNIDNNPIQ